MCIAPSLSEVHNSRKDVFSTPDREWQFEDEFEFNEDYSVVLTNCPPEISFLNITEEFFSSANIYADVEQYGDDPGTWLLCLESLAEMNAALTNLWSFSTTAIALQHYSGNN
jgi:hypothetical protein